MKSTRVFRWLPFSLAAGFLSLSVSTYAAAPVVSNVRASQRTGTKLVDIYYDVADPDNATLKVSVAVSTNGGVSYFSPGPSVNGALGAAIAPGSNKKITWNAGVDLPTKLFSNVRVSVTASDAPPLLGMALIPAGSYACYMGRAYTGEGDSDEVPVHSVCVSAFWMDRYEVAKARWDEVYAWAIAHGYSFGNAGSAKAANHPVHTVSWYDCVKWCNARSEKEGWAPAYYTSTAQTTVYRSGQLDVQDDWVKWDAGYRLPTEAEWERATQRWGWGQRFPCGDTISWNQANYYANPTVYAYDVNPAQGYHPHFQSGGAPYTSPVGYFAPDGFGLYDMAGNVWEWCWDWYDVAWYENPGATQKDSHGPASGSCRVLRGGSWSESAHQLRCANRSNNSPNATSSGGYGFRCVLPSGQLRPKTPIPGPVAWWTFDAKDTDWSAYTTRDVSDHGNTGSLFVYNPFYETIPSSLSTGKVSEAFLFDGNVTSVSLASNPHISVSSPSSACTWAYTTDINASTGGYNQTLLNFYTDRSNGVHMGSVIWSGKLFVSYRSGGTYYGVQSDSQVFANDVWTHVCYVWDGSTVTLYANGSAVVATSANTDSAGLSNAIGAHDDCGDGTWSGAVDEMLIFNRALTADEVRAIYNAGVNGRNPSWGP